MALFMLFMMIATAAVQGGSQTFSSTATYANESASDGSSSSVSSTSSSSTVDASRIRTIRFSGSLDVREGRLEVYYNGSWGTVCDDEFDNRDASVACYMLGYGRQGAVIYNRFGPGSGNIWLDDLACTGNEEKFDNCRHRGQGVHNCQHFEDVAISCPAEIDVNQIIGCFADASSRDLSGESIEIKNMTLEICRAYCLNQGFMYAGAQFSKECYCGNRYGTYNTSKAICELNCAGNSNQTCGGHWANTVIRTGYVPGLLTIQPTNKTIFHHGDNLTCVIVDSNLQHECKWIMSEDRWPTSFPGGRVTVDICDLILAPMTSYQVANEKHVSTQLIALTSQAHVVSVRRNITVAFTTEEYERTCGSLVSYKAVAIGATTTFTCNAIGLPPHRVIWNKVGALTSDVVTAVATGPGSRFNVTYSPEMSQLTITDIRLDDAGIYSCRLHPWFMHVYTPRRRIIARGSLTVLAEPRCTNSSNSDELDCQVSYAGEIQPNITCQNDTHAVAQPINKTYETVLHTSVSYLYRLPPNVSCSAIFAKEQNVVYNYVWTSSESRLAPSTTTKTTASPPTVSVRLAGSLVANAGRLEVYYNGSWGTVCDDGFTDLAAQVACYTLGYGRAGQKINNYYGSGTGQIWLDNVHCSGSESTIAACAHNPWGRHDCSHTEDVTIACNVTTRTSTTTSKTTTTTTSPPTVSVRLAGSSVAGEGRLEVHYNDAWGTVCDDVFTDNAAQVACYMLGYGRQGRMIYSKYGPGSGQIWLDNVKCSGMESTIAACTHLPWGAHDCSHTEDVSIICKSTTITTTTTTSPPTVSVRLAGSSVPGEGRLEVYYNNAWGTVCDDVFTDNAAQVACNMLGYGRRGLMINNKYGPGTGQIWLDNVNCSGMESTIAACVHLPWGAHDCSHTEDVAIICNSTTITTTTTSPTVSVRLAGSSVAGEGRLEVYYKGVWGTVCDDVINNYAAQVACYMLGYGRQGRIINNKYGPGTGQIWLDNVNCSGMESTIAACAHIPWGTHDCRHTEDVAIICNSTTIISTITSKTATTTGQAVSVWTIIDAAAVVVLVAAAITIAALVIRKYGKRCASTGSRYSRMRDDEEYREFNELSTAAAAAAYVAPGAAPVIADTHASQYTSFAADPSENAQRT